MIGLDGTLIFYQTEDVERRLSKHRLTPIILWEAVKAGYDSLSESSVNSPPSGKGIGVWSAETGRLRDILLPRGWGKRDRDFSSSVFHYESQMAVIVMAGNDETGLMDGKPKSRSKKVSRTKKGVAIRNAIEVNKHFSAYQMNPLWIKEMASTERPFRTWVLLHNIGPNTATFDDVRIELSLPVGLTNGFVSAWQERLLVARPFEMQAVKDIVKRNYDPTDSGVEIRVERR